MGSFRGPGFNDNTVTFNYRNLQEVVEVEVDEKWKKKKKSLRRSVVGKAARSVEIVEELP